MCHYLLIRTAQFLHSLSFLCSVPKYSRANHRFQWRKVTEEEIKGANDISRARGKTIFADEWESKAAPIRLSRVFAYSIKPRLASIVESRFERARLLRELASSRKRASAESDDRSKFHADLWTWKLPVYRSQSRGGLIGSGCRRYSSRSWTEWTRSSRSLQISRETDSTPRLNDRFNVLL